MTTISFRADQPAKDALDELTSDGTERSEAIRQALVLAARSHRRAQMRAEALALADDESEQAEMRAVQEDMADIRAW